MQLLGMLAILVSLPRLSSRAHSILAAHAAGEVNGQVLQIRRGVEGSAV